MLTFPQVYEELLGADVPTAQSLTAAFEAILAGTWTAAQSAALVVALHVRGQQEAALVAASCVLRGKMLPVVHDLRAVIDTCGTVGDGKHTLNLSTAAAIVVSACGFPVAKHGGRRLSSRCGSADVLEALGVRFELSPERHAQLLAQLGITFLPALSHHPSAKHLAAPRRELGVSTFLNALGAINNPAGATHQLIGVFDDRLRRPLASALGRLGARHAWVVWGEDGLDEVSPCAPTRVTELAAGTLVERIVTPEEFGMRRCHPGDIAGGEAAHNAARILSILRNQEDPATDAVILNAAAAIAIAREATAQSELRDAAAMAHAALRTGAALRTLEMWRTASERATPERAA